MYTYLYANIVVYNFITSICPDECRLNIFCITHDRVSLLSKMPRWTDRLKKDRGKGMAGMIRSERIFFINNPFLVCYILQRCEIVSSKKFSAANRLWNGAHWGPLLAMLYGNGNFYRIRIHRHDTHIYLRSYIRS